MTRNEIDVDDSLFDFEDRPDLPLPTVPVVGAVATETARAQAAEALLAPLASPTLTGTPVAPTAAPGPNTTQLATKLGVTENTVRRWEIGDRHPRWETMAALVKLKSQVKQ
mgnify:CR=1 FL=1